MIGKPEREQAGRRMRVVAAIVTSSLTLACASCGPTIQPLPRDPFPDDAWRDAAAPLPIGERALDTLNVPAGDHTDWKRIVADQRGTLLIELRVYREPSSKSSSGHLQIVNPRKVVVLSQELHPEQEAYEIEVPVVHPGAWLVGLSLRRGVLSYELRSRWKH